MYKFIAASIMLLASFSSNAGLVLTDGDSFSASFNLISDGDYYKLTDNYWEVGIPIIDDGNHPFRAPINTSYITLTLYENTNFTGEIFSETQDSRNWLGDYALYFFGHEGFFSDLDGSLTISYSGPGQAEFFDNIIVANFAGAQGPSNVAYASIHPTASAVPLPAAGWLMLSGIGALGLIRRKRN